MSGMTKSGAYGTGKENISILYNMSIRTPNGKLNPRTLDTISRNYFNDFKRLNKIVKKGSPETIGNQKNQRNPSKRKKETNRRRREGTENTKTKPTEYSKTT